MATKRRLNPCQRPGCTRLAVRTYCSIGCAMVVIRARRPRVVRPMCAAGCGRRVKTGKPKYCSPQCVPRSLRAENCRKGRKTFAYRRRAQAFRGDLARLGRSVTREDLLDVFQAVYLRAYNSGFQCGRVGASIEDARARGAA